MFFTFHSIGICPAELVTKTRRLQSHCLYTGPRPRHAHATPTPRPHPPPPHHATPATPKPRPRHAQATPPKPRPGHAQATPSHAHKPRPSHAQATPTPRPGHAQATPKPRPSTPKPPQATPTPRPRHAQATPNWAGARKRVHTFFFKVNPTVNCLGEKNKHFLKPANQKQEINFVWHLFWTQCHCVFLIHTCIAYSLSGALCTVSVLVKLSCCSKICKRSKQPSAHPLFVWNNTNHSKCSITSGFL